MEKIFFVKNGELSEVNTWLQKGGRIKSIQPVAESISAYGYAAFEAEGASCYNKEKSGSYVGDIFAYVVVEFD